MKTKIRKIAIALTFVFGAFGVNATGLMNPELLGMNDRNLEVEARMLSNGVKINDSNVVAANIEGKNGVVHVIDKVLIP